ncbi:hypothetical protein CPB83DRAFT_888976 [Crepidotus variabilis]|uniref:F-box domain-containing protein n=1 Tax=Crepidotus variabilis TaxID=179855 RepID=A0A9P6EUD9_9AGAR|nr:hypothetical protein CPB83DRAFT_888976 [Crepidotus variabilis]
MAFARLPQELIDNIVDHLDNDEDLFSCSLVSHLFLLRCRQLLFHTLWIVYSKSGHIFLTLNDLKDKKPGVVEFLDLLLKRPILQSYIQRLRLDLSFPALFFFGFQMFHHSELLDVLRLLCPTVQDFTLTLADKTQPKMHRYIRETHKFWRPFILQHVTTLNLEGLDMLPFNLASFSNLIALTARRCTFELGSGLPASSREQTSRVGHLKSFSVSLDPAYMESSLRCAEGVLQWSASSIERFKLVYHAGAGDLGSPNVTIGNCTEGIKSSKILSLPNLPSLRHLDFEILDDLFYREESGFSPIAELLKTCTPNSKLSSISVLTTLHISHSRLPKATDDLYENWEWRNWGVLDQPLYDIGRTLQRSISLEVHAHVEARRNRRLRFPKPDLGKDPDFKSLFRDKFPKACRSEFLSWNYDWTIYEC